MVEREKKEVIGVCRQDIRSFTLAHTDLQDSTLLCRCMNTFMQIYPRSFDGNCKVTDLILRVWYIPLCNTTSIAAVAK